MQNVVLGGGGDWLIYKKCTLLNDGKFSELDTYMDGLYIVSLDTVSHGIKIVLCPCYLPP